MAIYRLLSIANQRVFDRVEYQAEDDTEALALFAIRGETTDCELWCGERRVATIPRGADPILVDLAQ